MRFRRRILVDYQRNGRTVKGLIDVARDGYLWFLDRGNGGAIKFVEGKPYVYQNVFRSLDPVTGRPDVDPAHKPGTNKRAEFCPGTAGGKNWPPIAYSPQTRMIYVPANEQRLRRNYRPGRGHLCCGQGLRGCNVSAARSCRRRPPIILARCKPGTSIQVKKYGRITSRNRRIGERCSPQREGWSLAAAPTIARSARSTRKTAKLLWEFPTSSGVEAPVTTYVVDGKQYIAVLSGWGGDANGMNGTIQRTVSGVPSVPEGGSVWVFALE